MAMRTMRQAVGGRRLVARQEIAPLVHPWPARRKGGGEDRQKLGNGETGEPRKRRRQWTWAPRQGWRKMKQMFRRFALWRRELQWRAACLSPNRYRASA